MLSARLIRPDEPPKVLDMPTLQRKNKAAADIKAQAWECKFCDQPMTPRIGAVRSWHFAHKPKASPCPFESESEHESDHHRLLKITSAEALRRHFGDQVQSLEYEVRLKEAGRIADALIILKDDSRIAVEAQLANITFEALQERTYSYIDAEIEVIWVFLEERVKQNGPWRAYREWLLAEGCLVLTATSVIEEKTLPLAT